jgi:3-oxoacyl-[acyl-carrier-protein] synthase-1
MSSPDPEGTRRAAGHAAALRTRTTRRHADRLLNLHGTATEHNDRMESRAVAAVTFPHGVPCSSTKSLTGHTLAAAGALEAAFCWLSLDRRPRERRLPPHVWDGEADPELPPLVVRCRRQPLACEGPRRLMSNSFAFGGNNACLILGDGPKDETLAHRRSAAACGRHDSAGQHRSRRRAHRVANRALGRPVQRCRRHLARLGAGSS